MKKKILTLIIFVSSLIALLISLGLFWNLGIYVDEFNTSPVTVLGGEFWNICNWIRLLLLSVITVISGISLFLKD